MPKLLHIAIDSKLSSISKAFLEVLGIDNYLEIYKYDNININGIKAFNDFKPDIVYMQIQEDNIINNQTLEYFKENGAFVINWTGDKRKNIPNWMLSSAHFVDVTAFSNMEDVRKLNSLGYRSEYLEIGYDENIYTNIGGSNYDYKVVFSGNNYGNNFHPMSNFRIGIAEYLKSFYGNDFGLFGMNWLHANGDFNHSQHEEANIYRGSKIAINCSHFNVARYNSDRLLRILGSGTFCLSYAHPEMEQDYENYKHLVYFNSLEDLKNKIDYYLENEDERKKIAYNGQQLVLNRNTFKHQVKNIIKLAQ